ncbi:MAG: Putative PAS/PAC sensor protein [Methanocalculus sp. 52_23]|nr:MAG: Putative PAS/PAC sensor protein [Methanocalculus sp. 52_23]
MHSHTRGIRLTDTNKPGISEYEMLKRTFNAIEDPIFYLAPDSTIIHANPASAALLNTPLEEIVGSHCYQIVHHTPSNIRGCPFIQAKKTKKRESYTVNLGSHWYQVTIDPVLGDDGELIGAVHILTNIDSIKKIHELRAVLGAIIETTPDPIISETPDGHVISWNKGAEETLGYTAEEMRGESIQRIIPEDLRQQHLETLAKIQRGERVEQMETRRIRRDGEIIEFSLSLSPILDDRGITTGIAVIMHDLTEIKKAQRALLAYITEAALRLKNPIEIIARSIEEIADLHMAGEIDDEELNTSLMIQVRHAEKIIENIRELQQSIVLDLDEIPQSYRKFLMDEE